jgi:hypothetical protein
VSSSPAVSTNANRDFGSSPNSDAIGKAPKLSYMTGENSSNVSTISPSEDVSGGLDSLKKILESKKSTNSSVVTLPTHGIQLKDPSHKYVESNSSIKIHRETLYKIDLKTKPVSLEFGIHDLVVSAIEATMFNVLQDWITSNFKIQLGLIVKTSTLTLDFQEEENESPPTDSDTTRGFVQVGSTVHLETNNTLMLVGMDVPFVSEVFENFFLGDSLMEVLNTMKRAGIPLTYLQLETNNATQLDAVGTYSYNSKREPISGGSRVLLGIGFVAAFVIGMGIAARQHRQSSEEKEDSQTIDLGNDDESEAQFLQSSPPVQVPVSQITSYRSFVNTSDEVNDDDDSLGSDKFLNWPVERELSIRKKKYSLHDIDVDTAMNGLDEQPPIHRPKDQSIHVI